MRDTFMKYRALLPAAARQELVLLTVLAATAGLLETASVASVMPFLTVLAQPDLATTNPRIAAVVGFFGASQPSGSLAVLGALVLVVLVATNAFSAIVTLTMLRFANRQGHALAVRLLDLYLRQPYTFHLHRHTAELQRNIHGEVNRITIGALGPGVRARRKSLLLSESRRTRGPSR